MNTLLNSGVDPPLHEWQTDILPTGMLEIRIDHTRMPFNTLLGLAARNNLKRGFLFLSKVLGKHWPVAPQQMQAVHRDLVAQIPSKLPGPVLFIALAETAIGLGQGVFETWLAAHPDQSALFLHSSRYRLGQRPMIEFEETHSHAPRQFLHLPEQSELLQILHQARSLVLVDDEASTGNTFVNICTALREQGLSLEHIHLALITDFMGPETRAKLPQRFGLPVSIGATLCGQYRFTPNPPMHHQANPALSVGSAPAAQQEKFQAEHHASPHFGRLGIQRTLKTDAVQALAAQLAAQLPAQMQAQQTVLVLGTGEFMHPAYLLACALEREAQKPDHRFSVVVQSSTRSPILCWGAVQHSLQFSDNYGEGIRNYLYNVTPGQYSLILICHETPPNAQLRHMAQTLSARLFYFQTENQIEEIPVC